jgi:hypothetical protein
LPPRYRLNIMWRCNGSCVGRRDMTLFVVRLADQCRRFAIEYQKKPTRLSDIDYFSNRPDDQLDVIPSEEDHVRDAFHKEISE